MNKDDIQLLYRYNRWANATILNAVAPLSMDDFSRKLGGSFPSVRETLVHIMGAEWIWLRRWKGVSPPALLSAAEFPNLNSIKHRWPEIEAEQMEFVAGIRDAPRILVLQNSGCVPESPCAAALNPLVNVTRIKVTYALAFSAVWPARAVELNRGRTYEFECKNSKSRWHGSRGYVR